MQREFRRRISFGEIFLLCTEGEGIANFFCASINFTVLGHDITLGTCKEKYRCVEIGLGLKLD